jgi:hypothetical protein
MLYFFRKIWYFRIMRYLCHWLFSVKHVNTHLILIIGDTSVLNFQCYFIKISNLWGFFRFFLLFCFLYPCSPKGGGGIYCFTTVLPSVQDIFRRIFLSNCWWQKSDIWSQATYRYTIFWVAFLDLSDSYFLFADLVVFYTHWTYMHIFRHIFLSNYWWQKSAIWSQASYRYVILWEAFLDPSDSYFLFADFVGFYTPWTYMLIFRHIFLSNYWWQKSDIWSQASYRYPISWEAFLDPSDSYFPFVDFVDFYKHLIYICTCICTFFVVLF